MSEDTKLSEPTATDAVAGMLLRHGFDAEAGNLANAHEPAKRIADGMKRWRSRNARRDACIVALEALERGDLRGAADHLVLFEEIERLARELDEARAEVERLRARERELIDRVPDLRYPETSS